MKSHTKLFIIFRSFEFTRKFEQAFSFASVHPFHSRQFHSLYAKSAVCPFVPLFCLQANTVCRVGVGCCITCLCLQSQNTFLQNWLVIAASIFCIAFAKKKFMFALKRRYVYYQYKYINFQFYILYKTSVKTL